MVLLLALPTETAFAIARPHHDHEDLFDESDLQIGFLIGPQLTGFTPIQAPNAVINVQSSVRFVAGAAFKFIYEVPRIELDVLWNARGWVNTGDTLHSLSTPVLVKIPWEVDKNVDLEFGAGFEPDHSMFGADPHNQWIFGVLGSIGISVDFVTWVFDFEVRSNWGFDNVSDAFNGARQRDVQAIGGIKWHF